MSAPQPAHDCFRPPGQAHADCDVCDVLYRSETPPAERPVCPKPEPITVEATVKPVGRYCHAPYEYGNESYKCDRDADHKALHKFSGLVAGRYVCVMWGDETPGSVQGRALPPARLCECNNCLAEQLRMEKNALKG